MTSCRKPTLACRPAAREQFEAREHGLRPWMLRIMHNTHLTRVAR